MWEFRITSVSPIPLPMSPPSVFMIRVIGFGFLMVLLVSFISYICCINSREVDSVSSLRVSILVSFFMTVIYDGFCGSPNLFLNNI